MNIVVPDEFKRFTRCFLQGSFDEAIDERDWIKNALRLNSAAQRVAIKKFLVELLRNPSDTNELQRVWKSGSPSYGVSDQHIRKFMKEIVSMITD
jgi:hypothetical protein